jgi:hypothetical protein
VEGDVRIFGIAAATRAARVGMQDRGRMLQRAVRNSRRRLSAPLAR